MKYEIKSISDIDSLKIPFTLGNNDYIETFEFIDYKSFCKITNKHKHMSPYYYSRTSIGNNRVNDAIYYFNKFLKTISN